jgi:hypothetical protein
MRIVLDLKMDYEHQAPMATGALLLVLLIREAPENAVLPA